MPSSVSEGGRPRAARMRSYSSAVMLCCASICGVIVTGSGTTAAEELVIVDAFILAYRLSARLRPVWKTGTCGAHADKGKVSLKGIFPRGLKPLFIRRNMRHDSSHPCDEDLSQGTPV